MTSGEQPPALAFLGTIGHPGHRDVDGLGRIAGWQKWTELELESRKDRERQDWSVAAFLTKVKG